jgi:hypothetical protein
VRNLLERAMRAQALRLASNLTSSQPLHSEDALRIITSGDVDDGEGKPARPAAESARSSPPVPTGRTDEDDV